MVTPTQFRAKAAEYTELVKAARTPDEAREFQKLEQSFTTLADNEQWLCDNHDQTIRASQLDAAEGVTSAPEAEQDYGTGRRGVRSTDMPLYRLELMHGNDVVPNDDGESQEFADFAAAREEAINSLRELAAEAIRQGQPLTNTAINIVEHGRGSLGQVTAADAVPQLKSN